MLSNLLVYDDSKASYVKLVSKFTKLLSVLVLTVKDSPVGKQEQTTLAFVATSLDVSGLVTTSVVDTTAILFSLLRDHSIILVYVTKDTKFLIM
jgi:hypothetical protein